MQVSVRLGAILIPEYLDSIPAKSRIAGIYSKNILIPDWSQTNATYKGSQYNTKRPRKLSY